MSDLRLFMVNLSAMVISFTNIDMILKIVLLVVSIGYTFNKWYVLRNKNDKDK